MPDSVAGSKVTSCHGLVVVGAVGDLELEVTAPVLLHLLGLTRRYSEERTYWSAFLLLRSR